MKLTSHPNAVVRIEGTRTATIEPSTARDGSGDLWVELWEGTELKRAAGFKTWRGADRVVTAWIGR